MKDRVESKGLGCGVCVCVWGGGLIKEEEDIINVNVLCITYFLYFYCFTKK